MKYKFSKYNLFLDIDNKIIAFNTLSGALLYITKSLYNIIKSNDLEYLVNNFITQFNLLKKSRFIIPNDIDEFNIMKFRHHRDVFLDNRYKLIINPTLDCNFNCWYCYEKHIKNSKMSKEIQERILKYVNNLIFTNSISALELSWFGGEPLLYFDEIIYPLSKKLLKDCHKSDISFSNAITTNGFLINNNMIEKFQEIRLFNFQITLDGTEKKHNKIRNINGLPTFKKIINNINLLCKSIKEANLTIRVNYTNETLKDISTIITLIPEINRGKIKFDFQRIWQTIDNKTNNDNLSEILERIELSGFKKAKNNILTYKGFHCYADKWNEAVINFDGNVYKCTARDFISKNRSGFLDKDGKIKWIQNSFIKRFAVIPFDNIMCKNCPLLPICGGPCMQKYLELGNNYTIQSLKTLCPYPNIDSAIKEIITNAYLNLK